MKMELYEDKKVYSYELIIKTNKYAGNFERQMGAACTGQIDESRVGKEEAEAFKKEEGIDVLEDLQSYTSIKMNDRGWLVNNTIHPKNRNACILFFSKNLKDNPPLYKLVIKRLKAYAKRKNIEIEDILFLKKTIVTTYELL
mmetsp:Transcript_10692/g.15644  ORF Transcript_10692/g.15644 Transcript_10692/m.15644 type:complete len:142 (+) Transcript_10692:34-459(+)